MAVNPYNNYGMPGGYVPPAPGGYAPQPTGYGAPSAYPMDQYQNPYGQPPAMLQRPPQQNGMSSLLMIGGLALGGFLLFGPIGAIIGGVLGLFLGK